MSLIAVNTIQVDGQDNRGLVALNTKKISVLSEDNGRAHFQFIPFTGRTHEYLVEESYKDLLNAPVQSGSDNVTFTTLTSTATIAKNNVLKAYPHASADRCYIETLSGTTIDVHVIVGRLEEVVWEVNKVTSLGS